LSEDQEAALEYAPEVLERQAHMPSALLPEFIQVSTDWLRRKAEQQNGAAPGDFASVCLLLVDALQAFWRETQDELRKGMSGDRLRERCREGLSVAEQVLATIRGIAALPRLTQGVEFREAAQAARKVRDDFTQLLDWATAPPPVDLEKLKAAESGPFIRLAAGKAGRGPHGS
jgi:hypothetical protein